MGHGYLRYGVVTFLTLVATLFPACGGRDLRPTDHGLFFQEDTSSSPPPQDMVSFFGASVVELPEAKNINDATWWSARAVSGGSRDAERDHVRVAVLVASGVCGLTGIVLMVVSGVVFLLRAHKRKLNAKADRITSSSSPMSGTAQRLQPCSQ